MKRRLLTAVLAVCMALLPAYALALDRPASTDYWIDMTAEEARQMLTAVADGSESRYIVFVYYDDSYPAAVQQFSSNANSTGHRIYNYYAGGTGGESLASELAVLLGKAPTTLPAAVTFNPSTKTCIARENVRTLNAEITVEGEMNGLLNMMQENGVTGGSTVTPSPDDPSDPVNPDLPELPSYPNDSSSIPNVHEQAWEVLRLVNQHRMGMGLQPLSVFKELQQAANLRALELYSYYSHTRPDGTEYSTVFSQMEIPATSWAENIASGQPNSAEVMNSWLNSPGHRANIEKATGRVHLGVGYYYNNNHPSAGAYNWVQNFIAYHDCSFSGLRLSASSIAGRIGADLESLLTEANIEVTANCYRHGLCSLPLIAGMCSGYDANFAGTQTLTVTYGGQTATLDVVTHSHTWDNGVGNPAATCIDAGTITYTCTECGETRTESLPATGHSFAAEAKDGYVSCVHDCGTTVPTELAEVYKTLQSYHNTSNPTYISPADSSAIEAYLQRQGEAALQNCAGDYICDILDGRLIDNDTKYQYRIGIQAVQPDVRRLAYEKYVLVTEPLILILKAAEVITPPPAPIVPEVPVTPVEPSVPVVTPETYYISVSEADGGEVTASARYAEHGERVTISVQPDSGYLLDSLEVTDIRGREVSLRDLGEGKYSFTMPASRVTILAVFEKEPDPSASPVVPDSALPYLGTPGISGIVLNPVSMPFTDVNGGKWYYDSVDFVWKHYLMSGVSDSRFAPDETTSRAMIWTVIARMHHIRTDLNPGATWYERGMLWAVEQGVTDGSDPMGSITREQLATMLWRNAGSPGASASLSAFTDSGDVSSYAQSAMCWAVANGIMQGSDGTLNPKGTASRAEVAAMITRYAQRIS